MILSIVAYGAPVLRKKATEITGEYPELKTLISDMFQTMYSAHGVGLAAPQVGKAIRLFIVDASPFSDDKELSEEECAYLKTFKKVFINARIVEETGKEWSFNEGCLSIPGVQEDVSRRETVTLEYYDQHWEKHTETFKGLAARVIQHEYDHIEGILFIDRLSSLKKRLIKKRLDNISKGKVDKGYKMLFYSK